MSQSSEYQELLAMQRGERVSIAPANATGWTHVWDGREQVAMSDQQAAGLALCGVIYYSAGDGPNARVYRLCEGYTIDVVKGAIGG